MSKEERPKPQIVPIEDPEDTEALSQSAMTAAIVGNGLLGLLPPGNGYILIVLDNEGAAMATTEPREEVSDVLYHFVRDEGVDQYEIQSCHCTRCAQHRKGKVH